MSRGNTKFRTLLGMGILVLTMAACGGGNKATKKGPQAFPVLDRIASTTAVKDGYFQDEKNIFSASQDQKAIIWVRLKFVDRPGDLVYLWYAPDGSIYYKSKPVQINPDGGLHKYSTSWHQIDISKMKTLGMLGEWTVVVQLDGKTIQTKKIVIEE